MKAAFLLALLLAGCAREMACGPGTTPQLRAELLFGLSRHDAPDVTADEWAKFIADTVTPRFPDGLTVLDGTGQWRSSKTGRIASEPSRVVLIAAPDTPDTAHSLHAIAREYDRRFAQEAVGLITEPACVGFIGGAGLTGGTIVP